MANLAVSRRSGKFICYVKGVAKQSLDGQHAMSRFSLLLHETSNFENREDKNGTRPFDWIAVGVFDVHLAEKLVYGFVVHVLDPMGQTQPLPPHGVVELIGRRSS